MVTSKFGKPDEKNRDAGSFVADRRLYLDRDGNVVEHDSPDKHTLLVAEGRSITMAYARSLGLIDDEPVKAKTEPKAKDEAAKVSPKDEPKDDEPQPTLADFSSKPKGK